jgi:uncharacterized membrane protein YdjX (TVP38/TMEM64 family)
LPDYHSITTYINQFGIFAPLIAFGLFTIQAILPIFPYVILAAAGGILFGFTKGVLLSWLGALTGACLAYWMCRSLGYSRFLEQFYHHTGYDLAQLDAGMAFWTIILARVIPIIPTPLINAAAALGGVSFPNFVASSALGKMPTAILYTGLGLAIFNVDDLNDAVLIIALVVALMTSIHYYLRKKGILKQNPK